MFFDNLELSRYFENWQALLPHLCHLSEMRVNSEKQEISRIVL